MELNYFAYEFVSLILECLLLHAYKEASKVERYPEADICRIMEYSNVSNLPMLIMIKVETKRRMHIYHDTALQLKIAHISCNISCTHLSSTLTTDVPKFRQSPCSPAKSPNQYYISPLAKFSPMHTFHLEWWGEDGW